MTKESAEQFKELTRQIQKYDKQIDEIEVEGVADIVHYIRFLIILNKKLFVVYKMAELIYEKHNEMVKLIYGKDKPTTL